MARAPKGSRDHAGNGAKAGTGNTGGMGALSTAQLLAGLEDR